MAHDLQAVSARFAFLGDFVDAQPYGSGHINDSYAVTQDQAGRRVRYLVQRINHHVFTEPRRVMENIQAVTDHVRGKLIARGADRVSQRVLTLVPTAADPSRYDSMDDAGNTWRAYLFVEGCHGHDIIRTTDEAYQAARAFGEFQRDLADFPGELHETIPRFHDTPHRFAHFRSVLEADAHDRIGEVRDEIEYALANEWIAHHLLGLHDEGVMPVRVTHNDTKLNNVLLDDDTGEAVCIIDLDTVMPGLALYDFGDLVRTSTSPAAEDETDLSLVAVQMPMFEALVRGYLESAVGFLEEAEIDNLPFAGQLIAYEVGLRFLTDYLDGDRYFKTARPHHNRDRCRTQFALVESIDSNRVEMNDYVQRLAEDARR